MTKKKTPGVTTAPQVILDQPRRGRVRRHRSVENYFSEIISELRPLCGTKTHTRTATAVTSAASGYDSGGEGGGWGDGRGGGGKGGGRGE